MALPAIELPYPPKILSPNARPHWGKKAKVAKAYRAEVHWLVHIAHRRGEFILPDSPLVGIELIVHPRSTTEPDDDNVLGAFKAGRDGMADAFKINDNRFRYLPVRFAEPITGGKLLVTLHPIK